MTETNSEIAEWMLHRDTATRQARPGSEETDGVPFQRERSEAQLELTRLRRELEMAHHQNRLFEEFYRSSPMPVFSLDRNGVIRQANAAAATLVGFDRDDLLTHRLEQFVVPWEQVRFHSILSQLFHQHPVDELEVTLVQRDQSMRQCRIRLSLGTSQQYGHLVIIESNQTVMRETRTDASDRQRLEAALELANMAHWNFDLKHQYFTLNDRFYALCGTSADRERGYQVSAERFLRDFCHPDDRNVIQAEITKSMIDPEIGPVLNVSYRLIRRDNGEIRYGFAAYHIMADEQGKASKGFGVHQDITELMQTQALLRESQARFRAAIESLQEGFILQDADGAIVGCNHSAQRILGLTSDQILGRNNFDPRWKTIHEDGSNFPGETHPAVVSLRDGIPLTDVVMGVARPTGELVWISINTVPLGPMERPTSVVATFTDITQRKATEQELMASRHRLELLSRQLITTRENELQNLSHELHDEFGQVLTAMKMNLRSIQRLSEADIQYRLNENIGMIDRAISQVRNLAIYLRPPQLNELGLAAALHGYLVRQSSLAGFKHQLFVDPSDLQVSQDLAIVCFRITQEAITNAVRHAQMEQIDIELRRQDEQLMLSIRDDGRGFEVDLILNQAASTKGLGLVGMQERAGLVGGQLIIQSVVGRGTTITAKFPVQGRVIEDHSVLNR